MKKQSILGISIIMFFISSCYIGGINDKDDDYYFESAKVKEVWVWDRVEYGPEVYTTQEEWRDNIFFYGGGSHYLEIPYAFIFYENGYYDACDSPQFKDGDGPSNRAQFWKIEDSYFYTTYDGFKAKRDSDFEKAYRIISNNRNSIVLKAIDDAFYGGFYPGHYDDWPLIVTLNKKKYRDFQYDETIWW